LRRSRPAGPSSRGGVQAALGRRGLRLWRRAERLLEVDVWLYLRGRDADPSPVRLSGSAPSGAEEGKHGVPFRRRYVHVCLYAGDKRRTHLGHRLCRPPGTTGAGLQDREPVRISVPRHVLRGQGKDEHFEFEVKIAVMDEKWTVFRRYSRFLEMHRGLKLKYPELAALEFPPKKLFGNRDERMVAERRNHLERYLRNLFRVMLSSSGSPLWDGGLRLTKHAVCEFSPFFKKGVFEYSSHGTG
uniref:Kinesin family member 16Ba n=1 Tax=Gasterosteus aculeatus aculeatus TaxID=481459 RepID=A0AAQ4R3F6_GASAC